MSRLKRLTASAVLTCSLLLNAAVAAQVEDRAQLVSMIEATMQDPAAREAAIRYGKDRTLLCASCHGVDGNANRPDYPNLAGQNPTYLVQQVAKFADGRRVNFVMQALTKDFTVEDKVNLAIYYSLQMVKPIAYDEREASRGADLYARSCFRCHGASGKGEEGYARIAGQQIAYVEDTLKRYRANTRSSTDPRDIRRSDASMEQVAALLSDADITSLAHYLAQLR
ncbi:MAG: c-type cytochrome [Thiohalomonadaceae bacterium]